MTTPATPVVVGYISDQGRTDRRRQTDALLDHTRVEGLRLTRILPDLSGRWTISQLVAEIRADPADIVLLPAGVHLAEAHERISADLADLGTRCIVIDDTSTSRDRRRPTARLSTSLRRRETAPARA